MLAENSRVLASVRRILFGGGLENRHVDVELTRLYAELHASHPLLAVQIKPSQPPKLLFLNKFRIHGNHPNLFSPGDQDQLSTDPAGVV